eukprot:CAMPEP_0169426666 /NCGR_PEP_ID=MMETSP1042-20121227/340_1 /TAXON_ID=464988 /ORGANISM="Hemiselmis andersenii, Strain CCMP1180" /LENGTH=335 /DNA_ID=CAMNT_0009536635 /DNA_START=585 /DNA_END=1594 /DNA_ORIENTATION=+
MFDAAGGDPQEDLRQFRVLLTPPPTGKVTEGFPCGSIGVTGDERDVERCATPSRQLAQVRPPLQQHLEGRQHKPPRSHVQARLFGAKIEGLTPGNTGGMYTAPAVRMSSLKPAFMRVRTGELACEVESGKALRVPCVGCEVFVINQRERCAKVPACCCLVKGLPQRRVLGGGNAGLHRLSQKETHHLLSPTPLRARDVQRPPHPVIPVYRTRKPRVLKDRFFTTESSPSRTAARNSRPASVSPRAAADAHTARAFAYSFEICASVVERRREVLVTDPSGVGKTPPALFEASLTMARSTSSTTSPIVSSIPIVLTEGSVGRGRANTVPSEVSLSRS